MDKINLVFDSLYSKVLILIYVVIFMFTVYTLVTGRVRSKNIDSRGVIIYGKITEIYGLTNEKVSIEYEYKGYVYKSIRTIYTKKRFGIYKNGKIQLKIDSLKPENMMYIPWYSVDN